MLSQHGGDLGQFVTLDPKGKQIPAFLAILAQHLNEDKTEILKELEHLTVKIDHVKAIVATQQSYARVSGVTEVFDVASAIDDALKLNAAEFDRHHIEIVRDYEALPKVQLDKHKLLQILVNLVKNGKDALVEGGGTNRRLTFRTRSKGSDQIAIQVSDTGIGIQKENLTRIFSHGFTTKKTGHGFGLHSCANTAKEMGGALIVESSGLGHGATFTLALPLVAKEFAA
jgi:signal transduction histidine kinase